MSTLPIGTLSFTDLASIYKSDQTSAEIVI
jgi:hypothetical protein